MPAVDRDRGAVATVVAIFLAGGVLLGFAALVIDVGRIYVEREELITGADAAALAVAGACASDLPGCADEPAILGLAGGYANLNASDGAAQVLEVCGRLPGVLSACPGGPANLASCLGATPPDPTPYVEVRLGTLLPGGGTLLPPAFAQAMLGNEGYDGTDVHACARATWEKVDLFGITVSTCEFADAPAGGEPDYDALDEYVIDFADGQHGGCPVVTDPPWHTPDAAGWLDPDGQCRIDLPVDGLVWGTDLQPEDFEPPSQCASALDTLVASGQAVWLPVHDVHRHEPPQTQYRTVRVAKFVVTGYYFGDDDDQQKKSTITGELPCESTDSSTRRCVSGVFTGETQPLYALAGAAIVRLIG